MRETSSTSATAPSMTVSEDLSNVIISDIFAFISYYFITWDSSATKCGGSDGYCGVEENIQYDFLIFDFYA